jgi:hypothetical protein
MKRDAPAVLRKGAVIRVAAANADTARIVPAWAISYVDVQFHDGHVERWLGSGSLHDDPAHPPPYDTLVAWGEAVVDEHPMIADLSMAFRGVDRHALENAPIEIVIEWNAVLPTTG